MEFIVQASSKSWGGDIEHCMNDVNGYPAIYWTIKRIYDNFSSANVTIVAPQFDVDGDLNKMKEHFPKLKILYAYDDSPMLRIIEATKNLDSNQFFIRLNALNFKFSVSSLTQMYALAQKNNLDCVKFPDDYPVHFTGEIYKQNVLSKLNNILKSGKINNSAIHEIHPRYLLMRLSEFKTKYFYPEEEIVAKDAEEYRSLMEQIMLSERQDMSGDKQISSGDQLTYHYELANNFLKAKNILSANILDIACGTGYGAIKFANKDYKITAADYDNKRIEENIKKLSNYNNIAFKQEDITNMSFKDDTFDVAFSMETIEHVDPDKALMELKRVIKQNGYLILSTPQNSSTVACINPQHIYEYSLSEITNIVSKYFTIDSIIGLKAGRIHFDDDAIGANTVIFASNKEK